MKENSRNIDSELIKKAKKGSHGAFNILMNKYYPRVYASIFSFIKSKEDSEDLSQQTFIKVWQQLDTFRGDSAFFTWVYRIAINLAKNFVASSGFKKQKINTSIQEAEIDVSSFDDIESAVIHNESLEEISFFIDSLPESLRTAFILRESEGKSYEDIAAITETPIGTVRSRIFRARESIVDFIEKEITNNNE
ncbi:sigma-70 family RNA polymerase sigma factor [Gammaproteobacteria bacterium]|nr:sigma-70 family RNA polymerase sigma factor [Gammaproteobacteria bacterium]